MASERVRRMSVVTKIDILLAAVAGASVLAAAVFNGNDAARSRDNRIVQQQDQQEQLQSIQRQLNEIEHYLEAR